MRKQREPRRGEHLMAVDPATGVDVVSIWIVCNPRWPKGRDPYMESPEIVGRQLESLGRRRQDAVRAMRAAEAAAVGLRAVASHRDVEALIRPGGLSPSERVTALESEIGGLRVQLDFAKRDLADRGTTLDQARAKTERARRDGEGHGFEAGWRARVDAVHRGHGELADALAEAKAEYMASGRPDLATGLRDLATAWRQGSAAGDDRTAADCADELEALLAGGGR